MMNGHIDMSTNLDIATNPHYNIWVSANAGSGKTYVLSRRVIRLLAQKISPSKILCLTYTKAAANEMKIRVFEYLKNWVNLTDAELKQELLELDKSLSKPEDLKYARQVFAKVQDTPGGLKIQTIHSFCELLLHNFCLEADMPRHFTLIDESKQEQIRKEALLQLFEDTIIAPELEKLLDLVSNKAFEVLFTEIAKNSNKFLEYIDNVKEEDLYGLDELNQIIYPLIKKFLSYYNAQKVPFGYVTFDDFIYRTKDLLYKDNFSSWVHYKLDQGIDHVLVDEAQDTNPMQWKIIQALIAEFFAGEGQNEKIRSVFAVGDEKQSIYSFQGANAEDFLDNGKEIEKKVRNVEQKYQKLTLEYSYRSSPVILEAVDKISRTTHKTKKQNVENSYIEIWEDSLEENTEKSAKILAKKIANSIENFIKYENIQPKDIMILVKKRTGKFCNNILFELKKRNIAVAGLDRFKLYDHIAIRDLCALGRFALHPYDDLALANIFKSPILGLTEEELYELAVNREGSLWYALQQSKKYKHIVDKLQKYCNLSSILPPFEFYSEILSKDGGRKKFLARLGQEANDVLNEFLAMCLKANDSNNFSLHSFLAKIEKNDIEIKRELANNNEVRIMTIHGAKGLEAEIVFIATQNHRKEPHKYPNFLNKANNKPIFIPKKRLIPDNLKEFIDIQEKKQKAEKKRLLYVAMTRAKTKLFICGYGKEESVWLKKIKKALNSELKIIAKGVYRYGNKPAKVNNEKITEVVDKIILPQCLLTKAEKPIILPKPLVPSGKVAFIESKNYTNFLQLKKQQATARHIGIVSHKLLQYLPNIESVVQPEFAQNLVDSFKPNLTNQQKHQILDNIFNFLNNVKYKTLFSTNSRAEVAIVGDLELEGKIYKVSGQIDRLIQTSDKIIFCDYKTGVSPKTINDVPMEHLIQMALYYKLIYNYNKNKKSIIALLIYTKTFKSFELDNELMDKILIEYIRSKETT